MAITEYRLKKMDENTPVTVKPVGLIIRKDHRFLAASPDGKVLEENGEAGLLEVKKLLQSKPYSLFEAAKKMKDFCLEAVDNKLKLKRNHPYYFQVQGQLNVAKMPWVDFIVRTVNPYQLYVERIKRDETLWKTMMLPKLTAFYFKVILPELVSPRNNTLSGIREPGIWYEDIVDETSGQKSVVRKRTYAKSKSYTPTGDQNCNSIPPPGNSTLNATTRSRRTTRVKFVERRICQEWIVDETTQLKKWYSGTVTETISGTDGDPKAVYEISYDGGGGGNTPYNVDHLFEDYMSSSVKFIDI